MDEGVNKIKSGQLKKSKNNKKNCRKGNYSGCLGFRLFNI
jgi:hypothetical protein